MTNLAKRQTLLLWIALLAVLFGTLAPTVSHALVAVSPAETVQICSVQGYKLIKLPGTDTDQQPSSMQQSMQHCAFCTLHGGDTALIPSLALTLTAIAGRAVHPLLFYSAPHTLYAWSIAHPRAPPVLA